MGSRKCRQEVPGGQDSHLFPPAEDTGEDNYTTRTSLGVTACLVKGKEGKGFPSVSTLTIREAEEHCTLRVGQGRACPNFRTAVRVSS